MEKALVTGGAGFIGSNLLHKLEKKEVETVAVDNLFLGDKDNIPEDTEFVHSSVLDQRKLKEAMSGVDTVFHLAARSSSPMHQEEPAKSCRVNVEGFVKVVEAALKNDVEKVVYASTSSIYANQESPYKENLDETVLNRYAASKKAREEYAKMYAETTELNITGLRYFSVYGPEREKHKEIYANIISQFKWKIMDDEQPVIWGDGTQERDFIHVEDAVKATLRASEKRPELNSEVINVGTGQTTNFNQVVQKLNEELGKDITPIYKENRKPENYIEKHRADTEKMEKLLNFKPEAKL